MIFQDFNISSLLKYMYLMSYLNSVIMAHLFLSPDEMSNIQSTIFNQYLSLDPGGQQ